MSLLHIFDGTDGLICQTAHGSRSDRPKQEKKEHEIRHYYAELFTRLVVWDTPVAKCKFINCDEFGQQASQFYLGRWQADLAISGLVAGRTGSDTKR